MKFIHLFRCKIRHVESKQLWPEMNLAFGKFNESDKRKWFMRIKLVIIIMTAFMVQVSAAGYAQQLTLTATNITLGKVFSEIRKQTGYTVLYDPDIVNQSRITSVNFKEIPLAKAIEVLLQQQGLQFTIEDQAIIIRKKTSSILDQVMAAFVAIDITGRVVDKEGKALPGASVKVKGTTKTTTTNANGEFRLTNVDENALLEISYVGYSPKELRVNKDMGTIILEIATGKLEEVSVVNTGFQKIPKERAVGSFEVLQNDLINRSVSTNLQDRLKGITTGMQFSNSVTNGRIVTNPNTEKYVGITIRGESTFFSSTAPLIVVDNFPYEGQLANLNPNDVESITILKDASAASIWGARSGNGVIVITTKRGRKNQKMSVDFNSNVTVAAKPDLFYSQNFLDPKSFIEVEQYLFDQGYFNSDLTNTTARPVVSPSVEVMSLVKNKVISADEGKVRLDAIAQYDIRNDYEKYVYQQALNQQYSLGIKGGTEQTTYRLSAGWDNNRDAMVRNGYRRLVINSINTFSPVKNLQITAGLNYSANKTLLNNDISDFNVKSGKSADNTLPYTRLMDDQGNHLDVPRSFRNSYLLETEQKGFLDWRYRPLDELYMTDNVTSINSIIAKISAEYKILPQLSAEINYQNEQQKISRRDYKTQDTYYVRDRINTFGVINTTTNFFSSNYPMGGWLYTNDNTWGSDILRTQLNYNQDMGRHSIYAIAGAEIRQLKTNGIDQNLIGYDDQFGTSANSLNLIASYPTNPTGSARLNKSGEIVSGTLNRFISYYANASYSYNNKYTLTLSGRRDGANLFGAKTNDKITPLWSAGIGWKVSREDFYHWDLVPHIQLRATYGYNGNTYSYGTSLLTGRYTSNTINSSQQLSNITAPNPELKWERVKNINFGIDFESKNKVISGAIEYYIKNGMDLIQDTELAPQTGFAKYKANTAQTETKGLEINLNARILNGGIKWNSTLLFSRINDKVVRFDAPFSSIGNIGGLVGKPLRAIFAYRWAGLNSQTGAPIGILNGEQSEDYAKINTTLAADQIEYAGSNVPTTFGSFRNDFSYRQLSFSFNILYSLNYVFRRPSVMTNYADQLNTNKHADYNKRWQKPGDELVTTVPSLVYPNNSNRSRFYQFSEVLIEPGDHIRLQDIRLAYDFSGMISKSKAIKNLQVYIYARNLGILWRKNKYQIDPNALGGLGFRDPAAISLGVNANL